MAVVYGANRRQSIARALVCAVVLLAGAMLACPARADWYYWRTDAVQTNTPPNGVSVDTYCTREYATYESLYAHGVFQFHYLAPDPITRPGRDGNYDGEVLLTAGNCRLEAWSPYAAPPQWLPGGFASFNVAWAWCDGSAEWIPGRNVCQQPEERTCKVGNPVLVRVHWVPRRTAHRMPTGFADGLEVFVASC